MLVQYTYISSASAGVRDGVRGTRRGHDTAGVRREARRAAAGAAVSVQHLQPPGARVRRCATMDNTTKKADAQCVVHL